MSSELRRSRDLVVVAALTLVSLVLIAIPVDGLVKQVMLIPFVLILPGYALAAAMFPPGRLPDGERFVYSIVLSVGVGALGGLVWQAPFPLGKAAWTAIFAVAILAGCVVAWRRRQALDQGRAGSRADGARAGGPKLPKVDLPTAVAFLLAAAIAAVAIAVAADGQREARAESHFTSLWIVPGETRGTAEVGIENHQGAVHEYRLEVNDGATTVQSWKGRLGARGKKLVVVETAGDLSAGRLIASLYRDGDLYRRTALEAGTGT
jgi:uncharacterized membrane protein